MADFANATIEWGPGPDSITLLDLMKGQLGIDLGDNTRDNELSMYLDMSGIAAERYCDNIFDQRDVVENIAAAFSPVALRYYPVSALVSVFVDGEDKTADYELFFQEGIDWATLARCSSSSTSCFEQMVITYTAGFDPLPADLGYAIMAGALSYESGVTAAGGIKRESIVGVGSIEYDISGSSQAKVGNLPSSTIGTLANYRRLYA